MKRLFAGSILMTGVLAFGIVAFTDAAAQTPPQQTPTTTSPTQAPSQQATAGESITITGCVQREADYRQAHNLGKGGTAGTGAGVGNEYVLVNASRSTGASAPAATGTTGAAPAGSAGDAFELTGPNESQAGQHVGKRVEIVGKLKPGETGPAGATGGPTAGAPPRGVDVTSADLKLREIEITSVRETSGTCPTMQK